MDESVLQLPTFASISSPLHTYHSNLIIILNQYSSASHKQVSMKTQVLRCVD